MKYQIRTREVIEREYELDVQIPLASDGEIARTFDGVVRAAAKKGDLLTAVGINAKGEPKSGGEHLTEVYRGEQRVFPKQRRSQKQVAEEKGKK